MCVELFTHACSINIYQIRKIAIENKLVKTLHCIFFAMAITVCSFIFIFFFSLQLILVLSSKSKRYFVFCLFWFQSNHSIFTICSTVHKLLITIQANFLGAIWKQHFPVCLDFPGSSILSRSPPFCSTFGSGISSHHEKGF